MSRKRQRSPSPAEHVPPVVIISSPIEDRGSIHIGLFSPTATAKQLQARPDVKEASHRIAAWRTPGKQMSLSGKRIYDLGHDDDGEQYAGKKLERLLADLKVEGAVVVARWYGGILLGPVRFQHFENCAREAISTWRESVHEETKKRKVAEEDKAEKERLEKALKQRDSSIAVLRGLLAEKTSNKKEDGQGGSQSPQSQDSARKTDYTRMDLATLWRLEKARDGTIAFILNQIDKAEDAEMTTESVTDVKVSADEAEERMREYEKAAAGEAITEPKISEPS